MNPTNSDITTALREIELNELPESHPRRLARAAIQRHRQVTAIDPDYDFLTAPVELRQTIYNNIVKYSAHHSLWARLRRR